MIISHVTSALGQYNKSQSHVIISHMTSALGQYNRSQSHVISHDVTSALGQYNKSQSNVISTLRHLAPYLVKPPNHHIIFIYLYLIINVYYSSTNSK